MNSKVVTSFVTAGVLLIMVIILLLVWRDLNPLLGAIVGASLGWAAGILLAPYDEEKRRFERLSKNVAAFLGGYAVAKIDRVFDLLLDKSGGIPRVLDSSLQHAFWIALVCFIVTAVTVFVARTYE